jgi:ATP-dependent Clp protease ATP-binding subunit ClpC
VFDRFTERARNVVALAQEEARGLGHNHIGTEHLLLGLLRGEGVASRVLHDFGFEVYAVRAQVEETVGRGDEPLKDQIPFTPRAKKVLELALRESIRMGHNHLGTEHILLGLVREGEGVGAQIVSAAGVDSEAVRCAIEAVVPGIRRSQRRAFMRGPRRQRRPFQMLAAARDEALDAGNYDLARKLLELEIEERERSKAGPPAEEPEAGAA